MDKGADISECGQYRYRLWRWWDSDKPMACWIMLNPSTADADEDDPTIRKCIGFTKRWDEAGLHELGGIMVVNLFALRATDPKQLRSHPHPVTEPTEDEELKCQNDDFLYTEAGACSTHSLVVAAWGNHGQIGTRSHNVKRGFARRSFSIHHLGLTKTEQPKHPLYLPYTTVPTHWHSSG